MLKGGPKKHLPFTFQDFSSQYRANIDCRSKLTAKDVSVIWKCGDSVPKHDPVIPARLADVADVGYATEHDSLGHLVNGEVN